VTTRPSSARGASPDALRLIALAMAAALFALVAVALAVRPAGAAPLPPTVTWTIAALALGNLVVGVLLAVTSDPRAASYRARIVVSMALRETCGLLGAVLTLLGGDPGWALGLGGVAVVALLALRPRPAAA
jgi:hypothetical protein